MVEEQHLPFLTRAAKAPHRPFAPRGHSHAASGATEGVGSGIDRVSQDPEDRVVDRQLPCDPLSFRRDVHRGKPDPFLPKPEMHLAHALEFGKLAEHERDCVAHSLIRFHGDAIVQYLDVADRHVEEQLASSCFLPQRLERSLA
jgi:hypothetical protein